MKQIHAEIDFSKIRKNTKKFLEENNIDEKELSSRYYLDPSFNDYILINRNYEVIIRNFNEFPLGDILLILYRFPNCQDFEDSPYDNIDKFISNSVECLRADIEERIQGFEESHLD